MRRTETPEPIWIKFCVMVDIADIVTYTNFGDHRLRGFWVAGGQISPTPIDFHRRPYNTLALSCERVTSEKLTKTASNNNVTGGFYSALTACNSKSVSKIAICNYNQLANEKAKL